MKTVLLILFLFTALVLGAVEVEIRPNQPLAGEVFQLLLTAGEDYPVPVKLPRVDGIEWLTNSTSRSYRNINGKASRTLGIGVIAAKPGTYQIPSFPVKTSRRSKEEMTPVITLKVLADSSDPAAEDTRNALTGSIRLPENRRSYYLGEEVPLTVDLLIRSDVQVTSLSYPELHIPHAVFRDHSRENPENPRFAKPVQRVRTIDGTRYTALVFRTAFRSIAAGEITPEGAAAVGIAVQERRRRSRDPFDDDFFGGFFGARQTVNRKVILTSPGPITFKPLPPPPADAGFTGLVGNWQMQFSLTQPGGCKVGEVMTLHLRLSGDGGTDLLKLPEVQLPGFRVYPPETGKTPGAVNISWQIIPLKPGPARLRLALATFDPLSGKYQTASLDRTLEAAPADRMPENTVAAAPLPPAANAAEAPAKDPAPARETTLLYLKKNPGRTEKDPTAPAPVPLYILLLAAGPILWGASEWLARRKERLSGQGNLRRKQEAKSAAKSALRRLKQAENSDQWDETFRHEILPLLAASLDMPPGSTANELAENVSDPALRTALLNAGANAYLPGAAANGQTDHAGTFRALKKLLILFLLPAASLLAAGEFSEAGKAYDQGDFGRAEKHYRQLLQKQGPASGLLYNLGCAAAMNKRPAAALACFQGAWRLAPRDTAILENLNTVRAHLGQDPEGTVRSPGELLTFCRDQLRPDEWLWLACAAWVFGFVILAFRRQIPSAACRTALGTAGFLLLISLIAWYAQIRGPYRTDRAIVADGGTRLQNLPAETGTPEGGLSAGQEIQILEKRGKYALIRCGKLQGWIPAKDCLPVFPGNSGN